MAAAARAKKSRMDILKRVYAEQVCTRKAQGECYGLMKDMLGKN